MLFNEVSQKIIKARQTGCALCDLNEAEREAAITGIIFKVSVICGCELPTNEAHINALESEFLNLIKDGYEDLTPEEILCAFRMNANFQLKEKVEIYGKIFNIDFAANVLYQYRQKRFEVDDDAGKIFLQRDIMSELEKEAIKRRKKIIEQYNKFLQDENSELDLTDCFMQLCQDGAFANYKPEQRSTAFFDDIIKGNNTYEYLEAKFKKEHEMVLFLFKNMKATGKTEIYDDNFQLKYPKFELPENFKYLKK